MQTCVRNALPTDAVAASDLIRISFVALAAEHWDKSAQATFLAETAPAELGSAIASSAVALIATRDDRSVGFLLMPTPRLLALIFVHPDYLRGGIGETLWGFARSIVESAHPTVQTVELNATPNAVPFYLALGFVPISAEFETNGCRATRLACWLPARSRGCELRSARINPRG